MVKVTKSRKHNTETIKPGKNESWEEYLNTKTFQMAPAKKDSKLRIFLGAPIYASENTRCYNILQYIHQTDISEATYYRWLKEDPLYEEAHKKALGIIGLRLESMSFERGLNINSTVAYVLPHYFEYWHNQIKWRSTLKEANNTPTHITVEIPSFEDKKE